MLSIKKAAMTVPKANQFCCLSLKFVNQVWVFVHFVLLIFSYLATISIGALKAFDINLSNYTKVKNYVLDKFDGFFKFEISGK